MNVTIPLDISNNNFFDANMTIANYTVTHGLGRNGYPMFTIGTDSLKEPFAIAKRNQKIWLNQTMVLRIPQGYFFSLKSINRYLFIVNM